jgi:hypothetical protein
MRDEREHLGTRTRVGTERMLQYWPEELLFECNSFQMWVKRAKIRMSRFKGHFVLGDLQKITQPPREPAGSSGSSATGKAEAAGKGATRTVAAGSGAAKPIGTDKAPGASASGSIAGTAITALGPLLALCLLFVLLSVLFTQCSKQ